MINPAQGKLSFLGGWDCDKKVRGRHVREGRVSFGVSWR